MSHSYKSKQAWSVPSRFKRMQNRKQKRRLKRNERQMILNQEDVAPFRLRRNHRWEYF